MIEPEFDGEGTIDIAQFVMFPMEFVENWNDVPGFSSVLGKKFVLPVKTPSEKLANVGVIDARSRLSANGAENVRARLTKSDVVYGPVTVVKSFPV